MRSNNGVRGLVAGAAVVVVVAAGGAVSFSSVAAATILVTLLIMLSGLVLGGSWASDAGTDGVAAETTPRGGYRGRAPTRVSSRGARIFDWRDGRPGPTL
jgi:NAD(P)H-dependent flavin oxidoreductase YrpB (nitropropane dioxygenase family)